MVDGGQPAALVGDAEHAVVDVEPVDVDVLGDLVRHPRHLAAQVVHLAVVAAGVDPPVVGDDALDAVGQAEPAGDLAVPGQRVDVAALVADPGVLLADVHPERRRAGAEAPQHRRLAGGGAGRGDLAARHRAALAHPLDGRRVALADLLADLLGGLRGGLLGARAHRGLGGARLADPAVADRQLRLPDRDFVELVGTSLVLGEFQVGHLRVRGNGGRHGRRPFRAQSSGGAGGALATCRQPSI